MKCFELINEFLNKQLIKNKIGLTYTFDSGKTGWGVKTNVVNCVDSLVNILIDNRKYRSLLVFGYIRNIMNINIPLVLYQICLLFYADPIKYSIINLLDRVKKCKGKQIKTYCLLPKLLSNHIEDNPNQYDLNQCLHAISSKLWMNIVARLNNIKYLSNLDASDIVSIFNHMMLCKDRWNKVTQKQMFQLFCNAYKYVDFTKQREIMNKYIDANRQYKCLNLSSVALIEQYGWKEPIKSMIIQLISTFNMYQIESVHLIPSSIQSLTQNDNDLNNENQEYWKEIYSIMCNHIVSELYLNDDGGRTIYGLDDKSIAYIIQFLMRFNWNKQKQKQMFSLFFNAYNSIISNKRQQAIIIALWSDRHVSTYEHSKYIVKAAINLINKYGWKEPIKSLILQLIKTFNITQIKYFYLLSLSIKKLINNNCFEEISSVIWNQIVNKAMKQNDLNILNCENILYILKYVISNKKKKNMFEIFDNAYNRSIPQKKQKKIVYNITLWINKNKSLLNVQYIKRIIQHRIEYLTDITYSAPILTWSMKSGNMENKAFAQFLKSNRTNWINDEFNYIRFARAWADVVQWSESKPTTYSVNAKAEGGGKNSRVVVVKTKDFYNYSKKQYDINVKELNDLLALLT